MAYIYGATNYCTSADGTANRIYQVRLGYELQSQDLINNKSVIKLQLQARSTNSQYKPYGYSQTSHIDGIDFSSKTFDFRSTNTWQTFATTDNITVNHNPDGSYNVEKSGYFTTNVSGARPKRGDATVQVSLPTIPRASSITVNDANIGSATNIVINKASTNFTTTLWYKTGSDNDWIKIVDKTSNQVYGWTVPTSFYAKIPNNKTIVCYFKADTYNGDTYIGTSSNVSATFTATGNPVINSSSATDVNSTTTALTGNSANMVRYASNVQVSVNVSGQNSATISLVTVNGSNVSLSGTNPKTGSITFNGASTNSFEIKVTDSRGYQTTTTKTMTMVNYVALSINATVKRNQPTDNKVNISFNGNYFNGSFGSQSNTLTVQYRYKESTSSSWGNWTNLSVTTSGNTYSGSTQLSNMDYTKSYNFEIRATDKVGTKSITGITVTKGEPIFYWDDDEFIVNNKFKTADWGTNNTNDTWVPVWRDGYLEHRVIPTAYNSTSPSLKNVIVESIRTKNMFNKNNIANGSFTDTGEIISSTTIFYEIDYIEVKPNTKYTFSTTSNVDRLVVCEYNSSKTFIQRDIGLNSSTYTITTTANTKYVRLCSVLSAIDTLQFEEGQTRTSYSPYQQLDSNEVILYSNPSGTQSSITLSDYWKNYSVIEVFYRNGWICSSSKIDVKAGYNSMNLTIIYGTSTNEITFHSANIQFDGITVTFMDERWRDGWFSTSGQNTATNHQIWVTKIVGYN